MESETWQWATWEAGILCCSRPQALMHTEVETTITAENEMQGTGEDSEKNNEDE